MLFQAAVQWGQVTIKKMGFGQHLGGIIWLVLFPIGHVPVSSVGAIPFQEVCTWPYAHAVHRHWYRNWWAGLMLTVGNNELTYVHQFWTFCLERKYIKLKWPPYKCKTISVYCRSLWLAQEIAHSLAGEGDCKTCEWSYSLLLGLKKLF